MREMHLALVAVGVLSALPTEAADVPRDVLIAAKIYERDAQGIERVAYQIVGQTPERKAMEYQDQQQEIPPEPDKLGSNVRLAPPGNRVITGLDAQVTPTVMEDGRILLEYRFTVRRLQRWNVMETRGARIHLPETASRRMAGSAVLKPGETVNAHADNIRAEISAVAR